MKKICILIVILLLSINITACSDSASKSAEGNNSNVLTIATFVDSRNVYLEEAAQKFQELNSDIKVEIKVYGKETINKVELADSTYSTVEISDQEIQKYRSKINTELMSGTAPDIIDLSQLPYKKYIDSCMFVNIGELMEEDTDFNVDNYNTKIFDALEYKDGLYAIPMSYFIYLITGIYNLEVDDSSWNWQDFFTSAQEVLTNRGNNTITECILSVTDNKLFKRIFQSEYKNFVNEENKTASFTSKEFIDTLKYCKNLADNKIINKTGGSPNESTPIFELNYASSVKDMAFEGTDSYAIDNETRYYYKMPSNDRNSGVMFTPLTMYAVNNNSNNKDLAWKFIKFMLSDDMQSSPELYHCPVNITAFNKKLEEDSKQYIDYIKYSNEISLEKANEMLENYTIQFKKYTSNISTCKNVNPEIYNIVDKYVDIYFSGEKTAEETAQIIQNKVSIYLNEQR